MICLLMHNKYLSLVFKTLAAFQDYLYFFLVAYVWNFVLMLVLRAPTQVEWSQVTISFKQGLESLILLLNDELKN